MGCDGDRAVYCFGDDGKTPTESVTRLQRQAGTLRISDPAYLTQLARRGKQGSLWTPPPVPPAPPKRKPGDRPGGVPDPRSVRLADRAPRGPLWLVVTGNDRGDYYHESRELWDPATGEYLRRDGARLVRSKKRRFRSARAPTIAACASRPPASSRSTAPCSTPRRSTTRRPAPTRA